MSRVDVGYHSGRSRVVGMTDRTSASSQWPALVLVLLGAFLASAPAPAAEDEHPLEPPDYSSPRGTVLTLRQALDDTWRMLREGDPGWRAPLEVATRTLDMSRVPPRVATQVGVESTLMIQEILDRIELPAEADVPDREAVREFGITKWAIPHTELTLVLMEEGDRKGDFLFSPATIDRVSEFFETVRHLPYKPGAEGAHYDEVRFGGNSPLVRNLVARLPQPAKVDVAGQTIWQWVSFGALILLSLLIAVAAFSLGRRWKRPFPERSGWNRWAALMFPVTVLFLSWFIRRMLDEHLGIRGEVGAYTKVTLTVVTSFGVAWLMAVSLTRVNEWLMVLFKIDRPLNRQMLRATTKIVTIVSISGLFLITGQALGVPVSTMLAGLGVGGIAIALAAQSTVENLIGGINLYADQPVRVGDLCRIGTTVGVLEDVGLRSAKVRTLERTMVTIPNAQFAQLHLENLSKRDRMLMKTSLSLRYETTSEQLESVLEGLRAAQAADPRIGDEKARVRFLGFGDYFLEVEAYAYALVTSMPDFLEIQEGFLMEAMKVVERSGTRLALPSEIHYVTGKSGPEVGPSQRAEPVEPA